MPRDAAPPPAPLTAPLDRAPLDWAPLDWINPAGGFDHRGQPLDPRVAEWAAHVAAGRIGHTPPSDPAIVANREATARLFARPVGRW